LKRASIFIVFVLALGQTRASPGPGDSLLPVRAGWTVLHEERAVEAELVEIEMGDHATGDHRRALNRLLKMARPGASGWSKRVRYRLFDDLARAAAKLRLYPLAMKCYYNASRQEDGLLPDSIYYREDPVAESAPVRIDSIRKAFADGKEAIAYALLVEVKQPIPGKRKAFTHLSNVGHTFITLIKYNSDGSIVCRSFGFYPHKVGPLDATPVHPSSSSVIKDDSKHDWDELAGKFISGRQFDKILGVLGSYDQRVYNLNYSNCTDFGLEVAGVGGIRIERTWGHWPLGRGNNPGSAGQSMLEGKTVNTDTEDVQPLFVSFRDEP
jgi:hypothetical protein